MTNSIYDDNNICTCLWFYYKLRWCHLFRLIMNRPTFLMIDVVCMSGVALRWWPLSPSLSARRLIKLESKPVNDAPMLQQNYFIRLRRRALLHWPIEYASILMFMTHLARFLGRYYFWPYLGYRHLRQPLFLWAVRACLAYTRRLFNFTAHYCARRTLLALLYYININSRFLATCVETCLDVLLVSCHIGQALLLLTYTPFC